MLLERNMGDMIEISDTRNNVSSTKKMETDLSDLSDSWRINYSRFFSDKSDKSASLIIFYDKITRISVSMKKHRTDVRIELTFSSS